MMRGIVAPSTDPVAFVSRFPGWWRLGSSFGILRPLSLIVLDPGASLFSCTLVELGWYGSMAVLRISLSARGRRGRKAAGKVVDEIN
jgi:hypothetical protein